MKTPLIALLLSVSCIVLVACENSEKTPAATPATTSQLASTVAEIATVEREIRFDGVIEAINQATIAAQTSGRVVELPFDVGDYVKQGDVIVRITATEQKAQARSAQANLVAAEARLAEARQQFARVRDLVGRKLMAQADYDRVKAALDSATAQANAAREAVTQAQEQAGYTEIRAPYAGIVVKRMVEAGETVTVGTPLMAGLSLEQLRAVVDIPQQYIGALRAHQRARVILPDGRSITANTLRMSPSADVNTHTFRVLVTLPDGALTDSAMADSAQGVFPGTLVKVAFVAGDEQRLLLPAAAIVQRAELTAVYVISQDGNISLRYVRTGSARGDGRIPVLAGLAAGERVATDPVAGGLAYRQRIAAGTERGNE